MDALEEQLSNQVLELVDRDGTPIAAQEIQIDLKTLIAENSHNPELLEGILKQYLDDYFCYSSLALILTRSEDGYWHVFEGRCNPSRKTFKVVLPVAKFKANNRDPSRPTTEAMNFLASAATVRGLSIWIP